MSATRWEYRSISVHSTDSYEIETALEPLGHQGYKVLHVGPGRPGELMFVLGKDTGLPVEEELIAPLFTESQHEMMAVNWKPPSEELAPL